MHGLQILHTLQISVYSASPSHSLILHILHFLHVLHILQILHILCILHILHILLSLHCLQSLHSLHSLHIQVNLFEFQQFRRLVSSN